MNYHELGILIFNFSILIYIILYFIIKLIEYILRKIDKRIDKKILKKKEIKIYCEILKSRECEHPNAQCGNCKIWIKNCRKEYLKSKEYKKMNKTFKLFKK